MPPHRIIRPGYTVIHPNRERTICKLTRVLVALVLLLSVALMLALTIGGWSKLQGLKPINFAWCVIYVIMAVYVLRWSRGLLPMAAALALLLLAVVLISTFGLAGTSWFDRSHFGYSGTHSMFGGSGLSSDTLGTLTVLLIPVEVALIAIAMIGFAQAWNVELEVPDAEAERRGSKPIARGPSAAAPA